MPCGSPCSEQGSVSTGGGLSLANTAVTPKGSGEGCPAGAFKLLVYMPIELRPGTDTTSQTSRLGCRVLACRLWG